MNENGEKAFVSRANIANAIALCQTITEEERLLRFREKTEFEGESGIKGYTELRDKIVSLLNEYDITADFASEVLEHISTIYWLAKKLRE